MEKKREKNIASCGVWTHALTLHRKTEVKLHNLELKSTLQKGGSVLRVFYLKKDNNKNYRNESQVYDESSFNCVTDAPLYSVECKKSRGNCEYFTRMAGNLVNVRADCMLLKFKVCVIIYTTCSCKSNENCIKTYFKCCVSLTISASQIYVELCQILGSSVLCKSSVLGGTKHLNMEKLT